MSFTRLIKSVPNLFRGVKQLLPWNRNTASIQDALNLVLESLSNQNAAARENRRLLGIVEQRSEFIRKEVMFELADRLGGIHTLAKAAQQPRIVDRSKFDAAHGNMRINLGCGHVPLAKFINIDARDLPNIDVVADFRNLPFERGSLEQIHSVRLLEHFPIETLRRIVLPYWVSLLRPGGRFTAVVLDADSMIRAYMEGAMSFEELREFTFGPQEYVGDCHYTMFSQQSLSDLLREAGLIDVTVVAYGRRNGVCFEMEIAAARPPLLSQI